VAGTAFCVLSAAVNNGTKTNAIAASVNFLIIRPDCANARSARHSQLQVGGRTENRQSLQVKLPEQLFVGKEQKTPKTIDATYREVVKPRR
jgi:hypothetical protein